MHQGKSVVESESVPPHTGRNIIPKNSGNGVLRTRESEEAEHKGASEHAYDEQAARLGIDVVSVGYVDYLPRKLVSEVKEVSCKSGKDAADQ